MSDELERLLAETRDHVMTAEEREAQRRSFAYGNAAIDNPSVTMEGTVRAAEMATCEKCGRPRGMDRVAQCGASGPGGWPLLQDECDIAAAAFKRGAEWALDLARSTIDYQSQGPVAPSVDWPRVRAEMAKRFNDA